MHLHVQAVHSLDVGEAYHRAVVSDARGAFNVAAEPVLDPPTLGRLLGAKPVALRLREVLTGIGSRSRLSPARPAACPAA